MAEHEPKRCAANERGETFEAGALELRGLELGNIAQLCSVAPPPELDLLVRQRAHDVLRARNAKPASSIPRPISRPTAAPAAVALPALERCVFALGLAGYGGQLLLSCARLLWRSLGG